MHKIKFKIWHKDEKKISDADLLPIPEDKNKLHLQYTTLKDKNGNEIYEYDIISVPNDFGNVKASYYIVAYNQGCYMITRDHNLNYMEHYLWFIAEQCEVVKNYFEYEDKWPELRLKSVVDQIQSLKTHI